MSHHVPSLPWTDEQWAELNKVVQEAARRARVASSFLPLVGPLPDGQAAVPRLEMTPEPIGAVKERGESNERLKVDEGDYVPLTTLACLVYLTTQQAADPELASAKQMLARAADIIGRLEDTIVFGGQLADGKPKRPPPGLPSLYELGGGQANDGLLDARCVCTVDRDPAHNEEGFGENLVTSVVAAIQAIEGRGHYGPFACILGSDLYRAANRPNPNSLVLPSDRIVPFLDGGPLRRSSVILPYQGVVVALAGSPIDLVVAKDVHIKFLQLTLEPRYVLRVSERLVLRIKQKGAICRLEAEPKRGEDDSDVCRDEGEAEAKAPEVKKSELFTAIERIRSAVDAFRQALESAEP